MIKAVLRKATLSLAIVKGLATRAVLFVRSRRIRKARGIFLKSVLSAETVRKEKGIDPIVHDLKSWPIYFNAVLAGVKTFEVRLDDGRGFAAGDSLRLKEWIPDLEIYTGREIRVLVKYAMELDLEKVGVVSWPIVIMSIERI